MIAAPELRSLSPIVGCLVVLALWTSVGCATRNHDTTLSTQDGVEVLLRHQTKGGSLVEQNFAHPRVMSKERLMHILSLVDVRTADGDTEERRPAVVSELLEPIARGLSEGLEAADSNQAVVIMAIDRRRRLAVFTRRFLTSLIAFVEDEELWLDFGRVDWEIPRQRQDRVPRPRLGEETGNFSVIPSQEMRRTGRQTVAVNWRANLFGRPVAIKRKPGGAIQRRTVLMDSPVPAEPSEPAPAPEAVPGGLDPDVLRALADLEESRRRGEITESEYLRERRRLLGENP